MSGFCCPPSNQDGNECLDELLKLATQLSAFEASLDKLENLVKLNGNISPDLWKEYLKIISASVLNTDKNTTHAATSAYESLKLFNENYKLLKDAFENFYAFMRRFNIDLVYTIKDIDTDYHLVDEDMKTNIIFRVNNGGSITIDALSNNYRGKIIHIRNNTDNLLEVKYGSGVTITPLDVLYLRRKGSSLGLINLGNNTWDSYGELP